MLSFAIEATGEALERHDAPYQDDRLGAGDALAGTVALDVVDVSIGSGLADVLLSCS